jgi:hypothetical protein
VLRLSILIPYLRCAESLERTLVSVLANRPKGCEVLVALAQAYDDPYTLTDEVRFVSAPPGAGLVEAMNLGLVECRAPIVHVLGCGATVDDGWLEAPLEQFRDRRVAAVAPLVVDQRDPERAVSAGLEYHPGGVPRSRGRGLSSDRAGELATVILGPTTRAAFYRRAAAAAEHGFFDETMGDRLADVDLALRLRQAGYLAHFEPGSVIYDAPADSSPPASFAAAHRAERLFWRHVATNGWTRSLAMHSLVVAGELRRSLVRPSVLTQLAGRIIGCCDWGNHRRQRQRWALQPAGTTAWDEPPTAVSVVTRFDETQARPKASSRVQRRAGQVR